MPLVTLSQGTDEWHAARKGRITASVAAGCLGLSPYTSRQESWRMIRGKKLEENEYMRWGRQREQTAIYSYECETGNVVTTTGFWVHSEHDWLGASPDGLVDEGLLQTKCPQTLPTSVPVHYRIQMLIELAVTNREWCDFYCWLPSGTFCQRIYPAGITGLIRRLNDFREKYLLTETEPPRRKPKRKKA